MLTEQNITVNYTESGKKVSLFDITYFDDTTLTTKGVLYFHYAINNELDNSSCFNGADTLKEDFALQSDIPFTGYKSGDPTIKAKIEYRVFYANSHTDKKLRNPVIILDGFDPGDVRRIEDCDCASDPVCVLEYSKTLQELFQFNFNPERHESLVDLMYYYDPMINDRRSLLDKLREVGYDVIVVNFPKYTAKNLQNNQNVTIDGGAYYVESNAYAVVKLLQQTNQKLLQNGSTSEIVVIGPSMGGLISRFALAYMEKHNIDHNTKLWVSVDSPHLGANVPLGVQGLVYLMKEAGIDDAEKAYNKSLSSPAAQQMLIEFYKQETVNIFVRQANPDYLNGQTVYQGMPYNKGNPYFIQHYSNQGSNGLPYSGGWPQNLRKIAIVNGSLSGSRQTVLNDGTPFYTFAYSGAKTLNFRGFQNFFTGKIHIASIEAQFLPTYTTELKRIARFKKAFNDKRTSSQNINTRGVMDNVPGGFFTAQADIVDGMPEYPTKATSGNVIDGLVDIITH